MTRGWTGIQLFGMLDLGLLVMKWLAVAGGAAVGAVLFGLLGKGLNKVLTRRPASRPVMLLTRGLGAVLVGALVWGWVFGLGSPGGFGGTGGGWWPFGSSDKGTAQSESTDAKQAPVSTAQGSGRWSWSKTRRHVLSGVCPGVSRTLIFARPIRSSKPSWSAMCGNVACAHAPI